MTEPLRTYAHQLLDDGYTPLPTRPDGTKSPALPWTRYQTQPPNHDDIDRWFDTIPTDGLGVLCGAASGNLEMLEVEARAVTDGTLTGYTTALTDHAAADLWNRLNGGWVEVSPSGGMHWHYRVSDAPAAGNTKLARDPDRRVLIETRGEGGFTILAPSAGRTHPSGAAWVTVTGGPRQVATISSDERDLLFAVATMSDRTPEPLVTIPRTLNGAGGGSGRPGDDYNTRATWDDILGSRGWKKILKFADGGIGWQRPDKPGPGISATTGRNPADNLYVFSTSTVFDTEHPYSKFAAYTLLEHGGDYTRAARTLAGLGYGTPTTGSVHDLVPPGPAIVHVNGAPTNNATVATVERTSWWPRDLTDILDGTRTEPGPTHLIRDDHTALLYPGKVNGIIGESECGKSWIGLHAAVQALTDSQHVTFLDFEDSDVAVIDRLHTLDVDNTTIRSRFHYIYPEEALTLIAANDLTEHLTRDQPGLIILDGMNAAMTLMGLDLMSNTDATKFATQLLRPLAATNACVVYIDHIPKAKDNDSKGGIGAQAKRAMTSGCILKAEIIVPFGRGTAGKIRLTVDKDRPGHIRGALAGGRTAGTVTVTAGLGGGIHLGITAPDARPAEHEPFRPTNLMEKVSRFLLTLNGGTASRRVLETEIGGTAKYIREAVDRLVEEGFVQRRTGPRGAVLHSSTKPFTETADLVGTSSHLVADEVPDLVGRSSSTSSPPLGDEDEVAEPDRRSSTPPTSSATPIKTNGVDALKLARVVRANGGQPIWINGQLIDTTTGQVIT